MVMTSLNTSQFQKKTIILSNMKYRELDDFSFMKSDPKPKRQKEYYGEIVLLALMGLLALLTVFWVGGEFIHQRKTAFINQLEQNAKMDWCVSQFYEQGELPKACAKYL